MNLVKGEITFRKLIALALAALLLLTPVLYAQTDSPLPPVNPTDNPATLDSPLISTWDWEAFLAARDHWFSVPDPLAIQIPPTYQGTLPAAPFDLAQVRFVEDANLNPAQLEALAQNGFVVVPQGNNFFETAYYSREEWNTNNGNAFWVTTDVALNALFLAFENLVSFLEKDYLIEQVDLMLQMAYMGAEANFKTASPELQSPAQTAMVYYAVPLALLNPEVYATLVTHEATRSQADPLINAILSAEGRENIPFLGASYVEDFSQYRPRGAYTASEELERYFRAMSWLGRITFLSASRDQVLSSLFVQRALVNNLDAFAAWEEVMNLLTFLIGPVDNLGPTDYSPLLEEIFGDASNPDLSDAALVESFRARLGELQAPLINNVVRPIGTNVEQLDEETRGYRLMGQRFTFDGYAMQRLIYPYVGRVGVERILPSALDVAAVLGSDTAYSIQDGRGESVYTNYDENLSNLREEVNQIGAQDWLQNIYGGWLWTLQPLLNRPAEAYPPLFSNEQWLRRDLQTALASYSELKHATLLYTVQPMGGLGGGGEQTLTAYSYIEPNPLVFSRVAILATIMHEMLAERELGTWDFVGEAPGLQTVQAAFESLAFFAARLADMAHRQLIGQSLTEEEQLWLKYNLGGMIFYIRYSAQIAVDDPPDDVSRITDIASNPDAGVALQVGTGLVDYIYVVTDHPEGGLQLTRGAVYSFYEFAQDIDNRLTDEEWRAMLLSGEAPPRPEWIEGFFIP